MTKAYFTRRLLEALRLADQATSAKERSAYLRASRHYCDLLGLSRLSPLDSETLAESTRRG
jgi:hypothetical protein